MSNEHPISDDVIELAQLALNKGEHWMAYNRSLYFIDKSDVYFFKSQQEANEFAGNNFSERDKYHVLHFYAVLDIYKAIPYGEKAVINPDANGLYNHEGNAFTDALIDHMEHQQSLFTSQLKTNVMNNENLQYLSDNLKYMGFGETLRADLEKKMQEGKPEFQLQYSAVINQKPFEATMNFRQSATSDIYFFNNYQASLQKESGEKMDQTFYLNKGKGITAKEAFNLLDGRSVHKDLTTKEGQPYKAWVQLDFDARDKHNNFEMKQYHERYGFNLNAAVGKFAVAELNDPAKAQSLMQSLQKGNLQTVTIEKDGISSKVFMEADPKFKKVNLFDSELRPIPKESLDQYKQLSEKQHQQEDKKKDLKVDGKQEKPKKETSTSLLPKKRQSTKKGIGIAP